MRSGWRGGERENINDMAMQYPLCIASLLAKNRTSLSVYFTNMCLIYLFRKKKKKTTNHSKYTRLIWGIIKGLINRTSSLNHICVYDLYINLQYNSRNLPMPSDFTAEKTFIIS